MSQRKIVIEPDPILRKKSDPVEIVDQNLRKLLDEMLEIMYNTRHRFSSNSNRNT